ncbi:DddA-like double-stranded DNA deaminase toxin [Lentzea sp. NPDC051838]|uniref:DddA-like double-stranded DNA deaminase toxin n=1 Tax=Lentzea sp. NPDC051838 TaxID=3154849 RepID=UPI0034188575
MDKSEQARHALVLAAELLDDAIQIFATAVAGSQDEDADHVLSFLAQARTGMDEIRRTLTVAETRAQDYLSSIDANSREAGLSASPQTRVEQLRAELPPPVVRGSGQKTHGRWTASDGPSQAMISGRDDLSAKVNEALKKQGCPQLPARAADDVELKLAALMREKGATDPRMRHLTLVINNRPCKGDLSCDELLAVILPEGYSLTVYAPNYRKKFTGGAIPWWR